MSSIAENLKDVRRRIEAAAGRCGRDPASIALVAVSKTNSAEAIREAYAAGQRLFGENYAQELAEKAASLADLTIEWHFIGHLQKNKAKLVAPVAACVEAVDSVELAEAIDRRAARRIDCLIEVNIGDETTKSGIAP
ncbi:MAG: YggS family pyridoxal phosphate-dependent enzyme, partial [Pseudomonadota bacterium]